MKLVLFAALLCVAAAEMCAYLPEEHPCGRAMPTVRFYDVTVSKLAHLELVLDAVDAEGNAECFERAAAFYCEYYMGRCFANADEERPLCRSPCIHMANKCANSGVVHMDSDLCINSGLYKCGCTDDVHHVIPQTCHP